MAQPATAQPPATAQSVDPLRRDGAPRAGLLLALVLALATLAWLVAFREYYLLPPSQRSRSNLHEWLRPAGTAGLAFGVGASALVLANLAWLVRRSRGGRALAAHMVAGILAALLAVLHAALAPRDSLGGLALAALAVLVVTGVIGRCLFAFVPQAPTLLSAWRRVHRWIALLMALLAAGHIVVALRFADLLR